jgi:hypothetical protein
MKLQELIACIKDKPTLIRLLEDKGLEPDIDLLSVYMKEPLDVESDIVILDEEATKGELRIKREGIAYIGLLPLYMIVEMAEESFSFHTIDEIAAKIVSYSINDA